MPPRSRTPQVKVNLFNPGPMRTFMRREASRARTEAQQIPPEAHGEMADPARGMPSCSMNGEWVAGDEALQHRPSVN